MQPLTALDMDSISTLGHVPSYDEIKDTLFSMKSYSAPGPDGFHAIFFKRHGELTKLSVINPVQQAFRTGQISPKMGETLITLVPKTSNPNSFSGLLPISLCNVIFKVITKIIVGRLHPILSSFISPTQSAFLEGRSTADNAIILHEILYKIKKSRAKIGSIIYKIDLRKAYDNVSWSFLQQFLEEMALPQQLISLIMHCVTSTSLTILWNGNKVESFQPLNGLHQGDPLLPLLFVICMEKLSHLMFADDLLFFCKATIDQAQVIKIVLSDFEALSGLSVNVAKSKAFAHPSAPRVVQHLFQETTGIGFTQNLDKDLGFPSFAG